MEFKTNEKYLGLNIDADMKFNIHISAICCKLSKTVGILYRLRDSVPKDVLINLYYNLAYPYLLYGNAVWGNANPVHLSPLVKIQKKLIRIITMSDYLAHTGPLFKKCKILKVSDLCSFVLAQYMYKLKRGHGRAFEAEHSYNTRHHSGAVYIYLHSTDCLLHNMQSPIPPLRPGMLCPGIFRALKHCLSLRKN